MRELDGLIDEARDLVGDGPEMRRRLAVWDHAHQRLLVAFQGVLAEPDRWTARRMERPMERPTG
ncbi:MAG: hypothetical protein ACXW05_17440 [Gemmatirosa sp.]